MINLLRLYVYGYMLLIQVFQKLFKDSRIVSIYSVSNYHANLLYNTELTTFPYQMNYQIFIHGHFKSFVINRQLLFYSNAFAKVRLMERTLPRVLDHWHCYQITRLSNLACIFHNWKRLHLTSGPVQKCSKSSLLEWEAADFMK